MTVLVVEDHRFPVVTAGLYIDQEPVSEGVKAGVMAIMGRMLAEGTSTMSKADFNSAIDLLGAEIDFSSGGANIESLKRFFPKAFELLAAAVKSPAMTDASFKKLRDAQLSVLQNQERDVKAISARVVHALVYGKDHPNGEFATKESVQALSLDDIKEVYQHYMTPHRAYLTIVGDISPAEANKLARAQFAGWKGSGLPLPKIARAANPDQPEIDVINVPTAVQSEISLVNLNDLDLQSPDFFAAQVANMILWGRADAHLFKSLREKKAFTYGTYSSLGAGRYQTIFKANAAVRTAKTNKAIMEFMAQIRQMREQPVTEEELKNAKAVFGGGFAIGAEDPAVQASFARRMMINNLPKDFYRTYLQKINAVTVRDIQHAAQKYFSYGHTRLVVVGNSNQFPERLKQLPYPVKRYDKFANLSAN
jgi:zinc protease